MKLVYSASVKDGNLKITNRNGLLLDLKSLEGKEVELTIARKKKSRTSPQNRYYWGCVIPIVKQGLLDAGFERDKVNNSNLVHDLLKSMFCPSIELVSEDTGEVLNLPPSTASNSTVQMMEYIEDIQRWASEFLGVIIPDPGEQTKIFN